MGTTNFTDAFPGTHVTSWTDDEGQDMVTVGIPAGPEDDHSVLWVGDYEDVLRVWDAVEHYDAPMPYSPLFVALETYMERLQDEYAEAMASAVQDEIERDNEAARYLLDRI